MHTLAFIAVGGRSQWIQHIVLDRKLMWTGGWKFLHSTCSPLHFLNVIYVFPTNSNTSRESDTQITNSTKVYFSLIIFLTEKQNASLSMTDIWVHCFRFWYTLPGAKKCGQCEGTGVNLVDHFNGQYKAGASCWLCRYIVNYFRWCFDYCTPTNFNCSSGSRLMKFHSQWLLHQSVLWSFLPTAIQIGWILEALH